MIFDMRSFFKIFTTSDILPILILMFLMIFGAVLEMAGLTILVPIIDVVSNPDKLALNETYQKIYDIVRAQSVNDFIIRLSVIVVVYILAKNIFLAGLNLFQARFIKGKEIDVTNRLLSSYMHMPYLDVSAKNSADMIRNINQDAHYAFILVVQNILILCAEVFVVVGLVALMVYVSPMTTLLAFGILSVGTALFFMFVKRFIQRFGQQRQNARGGMIEWATQSLHALKEIKVAQKEKYFLKQFSKHADQTKEAETFDIAVGRIPGFFIETFAVIAMLSVIVFVYAQGENFVATLSLFALVLMRMMPTMKRVSLCVSRIRFYWPSLKTIVQDLDVAARQKENTKSARRLKFEKNIQVEDISFTYPSTQNNVLKDVSLDIRKGKIISIVGASGSGKSTLMDVLLGLLEPDSGGMSIDGKDVYKHLDRFRQNVSYLPQSVYLLNTTIRENIAFGVEPSKIKNKKIKDILVKVGLEDMVRDLPDGLDTQIGDIAKKISGGQQQRIGIARALYHDKDILFFDEATAGLDPKTEKTICKTLKSLTPEVTIISISHQDALINIAHDVYRMQNGVLKKENKRK